MTYKLEFLPSARKEWDKLGHTLREQFKKAGGATRIASNPFRLTAWDAGLLQNQVEVIGIQACVSSF
jgi:mRNA-degrading endonuclease RelE of RelBE toxin-antitoxin system